MTASEATIGTPSKDPADRSHVLLESIVQGRQRRHGALGSALLFPLDRCSWESCYHQSSLKIDTCGREGTSAVLPGSGGRPSQASITTAPQTNSMHNQTHPNHATTHPPTPPPTRPTPEPPTHQPPEKGKYGSSVEVVVSSSSSSRVVAAIG